MLLKPLALWQASNASTGKSWLTRVALQCTTIRLIFLGFFIGFFGLLKCLISHTDLTDLTDFDSYGIFPVRLGEYRCLQRKRIREIREIRVGDQEGSGQDEQASVQGDDLTMLNFIPDVPSDYSGLHPADALSLVSDARRLGLHAYI